MEHPAASRTKQEFAAAHLACRLHVDCRSASQADPFLNLGKCLVPLLGKDALVSGRVLPGNVRLVFRQFLADSRQACLQVFLEGGLVLLEIG